MSAAARRRWGVIVCCSGAFLVFLDTTIVNIAFPAIRGSFRSDTLSDLSWIMNGYNVVIDGLLVPAGRLADRIGHRLVFTSGVALFTLASVACAAAGSVEVLVAARVLQAIGAAALLPASLSLLLPAFPPHRRQSAAAVWGAVGGVAAGVGPSLGGLLVQDASWRWVFLVNAPIGLLAVLVTPRLLPETREADAGRPDWLGAGLLAAGVGALALAIVKGQTWGWTSRETLFSVVVFVALTAWTVQRSRHHAAPVVDLGLLRSRQVALANTATLLFATAFFAAVLNNVLFLTGSWHWTVLQAGMAVTPTPLLSALVARPAGAFAERWGAARVVVPGALIYVAGILVLHHLSTGEPSFWAHWLPGAALAGIGVGMTFPTLGGAALVGVPDERFGVASGLNSTARQLGAVLGVSALVAVISSHASAGALIQSRQGWILSAVVAAASALVATAPPVSTRQQEAA